MDRSVTTSHHPLSDVCRGQQRYLTIDALRLLGIRVTAYAVLNEREHERRQAADLAAVTDPALLDRLLDLPSDVAVTDPAIWAETVGQSPAIIERSEDRAGVTRRLVPPLSLEDVVINASAGRELAAIRDASLFAGFTRRWVALAQSRISDSAVLEAKLSGVGVLDEGRRAQLQAEQPIRPTTDGWSWLLQEKTYLRWLRQLPPARAKETRAVSTDGATEVGTDLCRSLSARRSGWPLTCRFPTMHRAVPKQKKFGGQSFPYWPHCAGKRAGART